jgi:hypothetical protein
VLSRANISNFIAHTLYVLRSDGYIAVCRFDSDFKDISAFVRHAVGQDVVDTQTRLHKASGARKLWIESTALSLVDRTLANHICILSERLWVLEVASRCSHGLLQLFVGKLKILEEGCKSSGNVQHQL